MVVYWLNLGITQLLGGAHKRDLRRREPDAARWTFSTCQTFHRRFKLMRRFCGQSAGQRGGKYTIIERWKPSWIC